jgi:cell division septal protein FtsQ
LSAVAAPADRRFRRALVKPARRRGSLRGAIPLAIKYAALALLGGYVVYGGVRTIATTRVLEIDRIVVRGNQRLPSGAALAVLGGLRGQHMIWVDLEEWRQRLLSAPWVRDALLRRSLPSTIEVVVTEREPVAIGRVKDEVYLIDEAGVLIDQYGPQHGDLDLPIVDGLVATDSAGEVGADRSRAQLAAALIASVAADPAIAAQISQVDVTNVDNVAVTLNGDPALIYVGRDQFLPRLRSYLQLAPALRDRVPDIEYVDLRFDNRIYVGPGGRGAGRATAATLVDQGMAGGRGTSGRAERR